MSIVVAGKVTEISTRTVNTKFGPKPAFTVNLDNGSSFTTDFKNPASLGISVGDNVSANCQENKYGPKFESLAAPGTAGTAPPVGTRSGGAAGRPFPVPKNSGEMAIIRQNSLTNAVNWYNNLVGTEAEQDDDLVSERIIAMAYRFAEFSSGQREARFVEEMGE